MKLVAYGDLFPDIMSMLDRFYDVTWHKVNSMPEEKTFVEQTKEAQAILVLLNFKLPASLLSQIKNLKVIANYAVGFNNIDLYFANSNNIPVFNTPDVLTEATAETALALTFMVTRRIKEALEDIKNDNVFDWGPRYLLGHDIHGKNVGVIGAGRIGGNYAVKMKSLGCHVFYYNRSSNPELESSGIYYRSLNDLLKTSDIISIHTPLTEETRNLIDEERIAMMKDQVILINTSRGDVIDEKAMISALEKGKFFGVGLDVYHHEPIVDKKLKEFNNVVVFPHIGSATIETRQNMNRLLVDSLNLFAQKKYDQIQNVVNPDVLKELPL